MLKRNIPPPKNKQLGSSQNVHERQKYVVEQEVEGQVDYAMLENSFLAILVGK
jgi:hypothetical protein